MPHATKRLSRFLTVWPPYWSPYFGVCMSILSKPANRALFISLHSQLVLIQHQFDATPSAPFLQFRARRAASRTQIPNSSSKDHAFTFMQSSNIMQSLLCEFAEFPSSSLAGLNSRIPAVSQLPLVVLLQLPSGVLRCSAVLQ